MNIKYRVFRNIDSSHLPTVDTTLFPKVKSEFENVQDLGKLFKGWFFEASIKDFCVDDLEEWVACLFFNTRPHSLSDEQVLMTADFLEMVQVKLKMQFPNRAPHQKALRKILLTLDRPVIYHRPMAYYFVVRLIDIICRIVMVFLGFQRTTSEALPFSIRRGSSKEPAIIFFHGLGIGSFYLTIGLASYLPFAAALAIHYPDRTILFFEMPSIQMKLDENHVLPKDYATHVAECLKKLELGSSIMAGHSLGTACVRWMDLFYPDLVHSRIFVDPIVFNLWEHHICHNALYRNPRTFHEAFLKLIPMSEPGHATYLHRYFCWYANID